MQNTFMNKEEIILFSVIIPTFNRSQLISRSIKSIIDQKYSNWELILVDDGSTDNTKEIVESFSDSRIKYYYKKNEERSIARNFGIDKSKGEYISFLDDDDYYLPDFFKEFYKLINKVQNKQAMIMCDEYVEYDNNKLVKNHIPQKLLSNPTRLLWEIQTSIRPFVIHKNIFKNDKFKIECKYGQDFHLALNISLQHPFYYLNKALSVNVNHSNQGTNRKFNTNYKQNAELSIMCIQDLVISNKKQLEDRIPISKINDLFNHKFYGFGSAAMQQCDFSYLILMIKSIRFRSSFFKTLYYIFSLLARMPIYFIKCYFK